MEASYPLFSVSSWSNGKVEYQKLDGNSSVPSFRMLATAARYIKYRRGDGASETATERGLLDIRHIDDARISLSFSTSGFSFHGLPLGVLRDLPEVDVRPPFGGCPNCRVQCCGHGCSGYRRTKIRVESFDTPIYTGSRVTSEFCSCASSRSREALRCVMNRFAEEVRAHSSLSGSAASGTWRVLQDLCDFSYQQFAVVPSVPCR